jgi:FAD/FMN-containing dehydrogenase
VDRHPALVARCLDSDDVRAAVLLAREHNVRPSVRGGGHDWAGRALRDGGLVLDLGCGRNADRLLAAKHWYDPDGVFTAFGAIAD